MTGVYPRRQALLITARRILMTERIIMAGWYVIDVRNGGAVCNDCHQPILSLLPVIHDAATRLQGKVEVNIAPKLPV